MHMQRWYDQFNRHDVTLSSQIKMKEMTTRQQLHMQLFTFDGFGLSLRFGVSSMATWHEQQVQVKSNCNVKINHRFRRRRSVGEFDTGKVQQKKRDPVTCI